MRILLIAYEFPPGPSPQSLRWARFVRELTRLGAEVHVLSVERDGECVRLALPEGVAVHRMPPGVVSGFVALLKRRTNEGRGGVGSSTPAVPVPPADATGETDAGVLAGPADARALNWKGRLVEALNRFAGRFTFPDAFGQWEIAARVRLRQLLEELRPDVVVSSHEPATTLRLGRIAKEAGYPWLADLGDPVLSFYTPRRWLRQASRIEAWTCRNADGITVTTGTARDLLASRHGVAPSKFVVLPQGYDPPDMQDMADAEKTDGASDVLELVYTGSFYAFRQAEPLINAVLALEGVRLTIATRKPPEWLPDLAERYPASVRLAGFLPHPQARALQRAADVLVNIANDDPVHLPGKLFEYLGARRVVLHIGPGDGLGDAGATLLREQARGMAVGNDVASIGRALQTLRTMKQERRLEHAFKLDNSGLRGYEWKSIGLRLYELIAILSTRALR